MTTTIHNALCACLGLSPNSDQALSLIRQAYTEPENSPQPARNVDVIYWSLSPEQGSDPATYNETAVSWAIAALIRAVRTFAQTFVSMIAVGAAFSEVDWLRVLSVSGVAFVLSILTSLTGLPEVEKKPPADDQEENG